MNPAVPTRSLRTKRRVAAHVRRQGLARGQVHRVWRRLVQTPVADVAGHADDFKPRVSLASAHPLSYRGGWRAPLASCEGLGDDHHLTRAVVVGPLEVTAGHETRSQRPEEVRATCTGTRSRAAPARLVLERERAIRAAGDERQTRDEKAADSTPAIAESLSRSRSASESRERTREPWPAEMEMQGLNLPGIGKTRIHFRND